jgi:hypothetical protein
MFILQEPKGNLLIVYNNGKVLCNCTCQQFNKKTTSEMKRNLIEMKFPLMVSEAVYCKHIKLLCEAIYKGDISNYLEIKK